MADRMVETLSPEQMVEMDQDFSFMENNEGHVSLAGGKPFKDKCYYILNTVDKLVALLHCISCLNDKVDEILHGNIPSRDHYDVSSSQYYCSMVLNHLNADSKGLCTMDADVTTFH